MSTQDADGMVARRIEVHGRVQGVFFRVSTRDEAERLGLVGWVRNARDGSVEVWAEGRADAVRQLETWIEDGGPPQARVERIQRDDVPIGQYESFDVRG